MSSDEEPTEPEALDDAFRAALSELEAYLDGVPEDRHAELVLPFASRWTLPAVGLDVVRLREEAELFVQATPLPDRILSGYADQVAWWISQRMLLDAADEPDLEAAAVCVANARLQLEQRAATLDAAGFPLVARAFRELAEGSAGVEPPADPLWQAFALRIAESVLPRP